MAFGLLLQTTAWALLAWSRWNEKQQIMSGIWRKVPKNPAVPKPFVFVPSKGRKNSLLFCLFLSIARIFYVDDTSQQMTSGSIKWKKATLFWQYVCCIPAFFFFVAQSIFRLVLVTSTEMFSTQFLVTRACRWKWWERMFRPNAKRKKVVEIRRDSLLSSTLVGFFSFVFLFLVPATGVFIVRIRTTPN